MTQNEEEIRQQFLLPNMDYEIDALIQVPHLWPKGTFLCKDVDLISWSKRESKSPVRGLTGPEGGPLFSEALSR